MISAMAGDGVFDPALFRRMASGSSLASGMDLTTQQEVMTDAPLVQEDMLFTADAAGSVAGQNRALWEKNAKKLEQALLTFTSRRFSVDKDSERLVVRVVNRDTDEVVRQIPNEEMLSLSRRMRQLRGILLDAKA
uniref:Putative Flagellar protein FlaG-like protein n=1 Tax=Magnetococcus massalia (strain MO-1) TaxID=451514 RepID=A0A1S7LPL1_MAGMO|nr:putative Flagellar protein FlaG-like protein [Candidatus Magnetococcus massalia]